MDGGNGFVSFPLRIPVELRIILELYQNDMKAISLNQAVRMLLETHPEIDKRVQALYAEGITTPRRE